jgi:hypothetical protein
MTKTFCLLVLLSTCCAALDAANDEARSGFWKEYWSLTKRLRCNSPDTLTGPFKDRSEAAADGRLTIALPDAIDSLAAAELYFELWGGHPGTAKKTVTVNGRSTYAIPEAGTADGHCTYHYPVIALKLEDLGRGENIFQFACEKGTSFWGHYIIDNAALRVKLKPSDDFTAKVIVRSAGNERLDLSLQFPEAWRPRIARVDYEARYHGYDEDGDGEQADWHGFTKARQPVAIVGSSSHPPFNVEWDCSMLPDQNPLAVRAILRFKDAPGLLFRTAATEQVTLPERTAKVTLLMPSDVPKPFWSRASRRKTCAINVPIDPARIDRAELHVTLWDGGRGNTEHPFTLNNHPLPIAGAGRHDLLYRVVPVDPRILKRGPNEIALLSDTDHHGIEVLLPGPGLVVRCRE